MNLTIKLYGTLRKYRPESASGAPHQPFTLSTPENITIDELMRLLEVVDGAVNAAAVNGESVNNNTQLHNGDTVSLFPPAAGG